MATKNIYVGDVGTEIIVDVRVPLDTASIHVLEVLKPGATEKVVWEAEVYKSTKLRYLVQEGGWSVGGYYRFQGYIELPTWKGHTRTFGVFVHDLSK